MKSKFLLLIAVLGLAMSGCSNDAGTLTTDYLPEKTLIPPPIFGFNIIGNDLNNINFNDIYVIPKGSGSDELSKWHYCEGSGKFAGSVWSATYFNDDGQYVKLSRSLVFPFLHDSVNTTSEGVEYGHWGITIYWQSQWATGCPK